MTHRFAVITGATSGIGEAFAHALPAATGLLLTGCDAERLATLKGELASDGRAVETVTADLSDDRGRSAVLEAAKTLPVELLINNAGLGQVGRVVDNSVAREREMVEVNVVAPVVLTRALLPGMIDRARDEGRRAGVIVVASILGFIPTPMMATYAASKAFDLFYAEALAAELSGQPVDILALCPGGTRTRFSERAGMKSFSPGLSDSPARVAREALTTLGRRPVHVVGGRNRVVTSLPRLMPRQAMTAIFRRAMGGMMAR